MKIKLIAIALIWLLGCIIILLSAASFKARSANSPVTESTRLLNSNQASKLVANIQESELWASLFPAVQIRRQVCLIRCHVRLAKTEVARQIAEDILNLTFDKLSRANNNAAAAKESVIDKIQRFTNFLEIPFDKHIDGLYRKENIEDGYSNWIGYQTLVQELKSARNTNELLLVKKAISARNINSPLIKSIDSFFSNSVARAVDKFPPPQFGWGLVRTSEARTYTRQGKFASYANLGAVIEISKISSGSSGETALGTIHSRNGSTPDIVIMTSDLDLHKESYASLDQATRNLLLARSGIINDIAALKKKLGAESDRQNPDYPEYEKAFIAINEFSAKANEVKAKFRQATGDERETISNELREMKQESTRLEMVCAMAKRKYSAWRTQNADRLENTPELSAMQNKLVDIENQLRSAGKL